MATGPPLLTGDSSTFEGGTTGGWATYALSGPLANSTAIAHSGTHSLSGTASQNGLGIFYYPSGYAPASSGGTYTFSAWLSAGTTPRTLTPQIVFYDAFLSVLLTTSGTAVVEGAVGTWVQVSVTSGIAPPNTTQMRGTVNLAGMAISEVHYLDDALLNLTGVTPTYLQWRTGSAPGLEPSTSKQERMLRALASYVTNTNPDGTIRGS